MKRRQFILSLAGTAAAGLAGWQIGSREKAGNLARITRKGWALGTQVNLTVFHRHTRAAESAITEAFAELDRIEDIMSLYRSGSQISLLNQNGHLDHPHPYLVEVIEEAQQLSERTDGAFDITVQPLWEVYFKHQETRAIPGKEELAAALAKVNWRKVNVSADRIQFSDEGMQITLNGIAQGFAADRIGKILAGHGIEHALIDTGEIGTIGSHAEKDAWSIGIKHPRRESEFLGLAALNGRCMATSGDYETRFSEDYSRHHLLDPHTGLSPVELSSVTVAAPSAMQADALSTAVFLTGKEIGLKLVEATPGADALLVSKDGKTTKTAGFPLIS